MSRTLAGTKRCHGTATKQKSPITSAHLQEVLDDLKDSTSHNDFLFKTQLLTGTHGLLRLGEMTWPDKVALQDFKKVTMCFSLEWLVDAFMFWLPTHKVDTTFEGNCIVVK